MLTISSKEVGPFSSSKLLYGVWEQVKGTPLVDDLCSWCTEPLSEKVTILIQKFPNGDEKELKRSKKVVCIPCEHLKEKS